MKNLYYAAVLGASLLLGGCAVYVPTVPGTPLLSKNQTEVTAGLRGLNSLELHAAWAPTSHLLLAAESAYQGSDTETTANNVTTTSHDAHRQVSLGLGYYQAPSARTDWYLAAVGGVGLASAQLHSVDVGVAYIVPIPIISELYEARYLRYYGQLYAAQPVSSTVKIGASVRGTLVDYQRLAYEGQPLTPVNRVFIEPTLFVRVGHGVVQGQGTLGVSLPTQRDLSRRFNAETAPVSTLASVGVVFRPDLVKWRGR